jgi:XTP/dITP diphosphohydrolase
MMPSCTRLVIATGNVHKFQELCRLLQPLNLPLQPLSDFPLLFPAREDGRTVAENAVKKAVWYARQLGKWVLADDTGLEVDALGGAPGVHSARYAGPAATMQENRARLLEQLRDVPRDRRTARFICRLVVADPHGHVVVEAEGQCAGWLRQDASEGAFGFGYDALFEPAEAGGRTLAELPPPETDHIGHRGHAARELLTRWDAL